MEEQSSDSVKGPEASDIEPKVKIQLSKGAILTLIVGGAVVWSLLLLYLLGAGIGLYALNWRFGWVTATTKVVPYPAAWVNVEPITFAELFRQKGHILKFFRQTGSKVPDEKVLEQRALELLIREKVVEKLCTQYGIRVNKEELEKTLNQLYEENGGKESFEEILWQFYGFKPPEIRELVRYSLKQEKLMNYFEEHLRKKVHLAHILLPASEEQKAKEVLKLAKKGKDFAQLAKQYSVDNKTKQKSGDLGYFASDELVKVIAKDKIVERKKIEEFKNKVWSAQTGAVVLFRGDRGWQIVKVLDFRGSEDKDFDAWLQSQINQSFVLRFI